MKASKTLSTLPHKDMLQVHSHMTKKLTPIHPGDVIREEILTPLDMSVNKLAKHLAVDAARLNEIVRGRRGITADTALRLAPYLGASAEFWLKLQVHYDLRRARKAKESQIARAVSRPTKRPKPPACSSQRPAPACGVVQACEVSVSCYARAHNK